MCLESLCIHEINEFSWKHRDFNHETLGFKQTFFTWIIDLSNQVDLFEHLRAGPPKNRGSRRHVHYFCLAMSHFQTDPFQTASGHNIGI